MIVVVDIARSEKSKGLSFVISDQKYQGYNLIFEDEESFGEKTL